MHYDVFISYSRRDYQDENGNVIPGNIISKIKDVLSKNGITYWIDEDGIDSGDEFARLIIRSIKDSNVVLFVSTENSNRSEWTRKEIASAISYKKKIIPLKYDDTPFNDSLLLYLADLDFISYGKNGDKALNRLVTSIKKYLDGLKPAKPEAPVTTVNAVKPEPAQQEEPKSKSKLRNILLISVFAAAVIYALVMTIVNVNTKKSSRANMAENIEVKADEVTIGPAKEESKPDVKPEAKPEVKPESKPESKPEQKPVEKPVEKKDLKNTTIDVKGVKVDMVVVKGNGRVGDFLIAKYEVTQGLWKAVMGETVAEQRDKLDHSFKLRGEGDNMPMYYISWDDCQEFINKLNAMTGKKFRMPTEAEWECAARGGAQETGDKYGWYEDNSNGGTHEVGEKRPNSLGLYDMVGNVSEWCKDKKDYDRVVKGGDWASTLEHCEVSNRTYLDSSVRSDATGLRLAL